MASFRVRFTLRQLLAVTTAIVAFLAISYALQHPKKTGRLYRGVSYLSFSPDGTKLAVVCYQARDAEVPVKRYLSDVSHSVAILDTATLVSAAAVQHEFRKGMQGPLGLTYWNRYVGFSVEGNRLYVLTQVRGYMRTWDVASQHWLSDQSIRGTNILDFMLSGDGREIAVFSEDGLSIWDTQLWQPYLTHPGWRTPFTFSPNSKYLAVSTPDGVQVWNLVLQKLIRTFHTGHDILDEVSCIAISPDTDTVAIRCNEGVRLYSIGSSEERVVLPELFEISRTATGWGTKGRSGEATIGIAFSPDGKLLAAWGTHGLKFFDMSKNAKLKRSVANTSILCLAFSPDGNTYATGDADAMLTIWDTATGKELRSTIVQP